MAIVVTFENSLYTEVERCITWKCPSSNLDLMLWKEPELLEFCISTLFWRYIPKKLKLEGRFAHKSSFEQIYI